MLIENLVIYTRKPYEDSKGRMIYHGYMLPKESEHFSAQRWSGWDKPDSSATMIDFSEEGIVFPTFKGLEILSLNSRGNGGRAYQVIFPIENKENFYIKCDLREDTLMDTIFTQGIEKGGVMNGEFAFIRNGSQTNLVLVGSQDYEKAKETTMKKKEARKITNKELKVGYEYSTHSGTKAVYLGVYYHIESYMFGNSVKLSHTPKTAHVFVRNMHTSYKSFEFKKSQNFTLESANPVISEEEAKEFFTECYTNAYKELLEKTISEIKECHLNFYNHYLEHKGKQYSYKWYYENKLKEEVNRLRKNAYEYHRNSIVSDDKSQVIFDKEPVRLRVEEAIKQGEESIAEYDFYKNA